MAAQARKKVFDSWRADRKRYPRLAFVLERSIWAIAVLRFGQYVDTLDSRLLRLAGRVIYQALFIFIETFTGISIPKSVKVGAGLRIFHTGNIVVHEKADIGANCTLRHGVTIGMRSSSGGVPVIADNVDIGANAMVLGEIHIGEGAKIGAGALVQVDMPPHSIAFAPRAVLRETVVNLRDGNSTSSTPSKRIAQERWNTEVSAAE